MSTFDLIRMGFASAASLGAAVGGFAVSQTPPAVVSATIAQPPELEVRHFRSTAGALDFTYEEWQAGYDVPDLSGALMATVEERPWRFIGVIGEGRQARAVFSSPESASRTMLVQVGDTLPDGRVIAGIATEHVLFGARGGRPGNVAQASGVVGPAQLSLFTGADPNADADAAFAARNAQPQTPPPSSTPQPGGLEPASID